ncbi:MAG: hypothetical protein KDA25_03520, partial [Phycisphaerales bacterium]|nr:hypothetical protein [Phycisphaerales bacterium]
IGGTSVATFVNTIAWSNGPAPFGGGGTIGITFSDIEGGAIGEGNLDVDPLFAGPGDYHLGAGSPCVDAGSDDAVPGDVTTDLDGAPRIQGEAVDLGAYERTPSPCPTDLDGDGTTGAADLAVLLASWGRCTGCPADLDGSGTVGAADLAILLAAWGACG